MSKCGQEIRPSLPENSNVNQENGIQLYEYTIWQFHENQALSKVSLKWNRGQITHHITWQCCHFNKSMILLQIQLVFNPFFFIPFLFFVFWSLLLQRELEPNHPTLIKDYIFFSLFFFYLFILLFLFVFFLLWYTHGKNKRHYYIIYLYFKK